MALLVAVVYSKPAPSDEAPTPYQFEANSKSDDATLTRQEAMDDKGAIKGSYSYKDKDGLTRTVEYVDNNDGNGISIKVCW